MNYLSHLSVTSLNSLFIRKVQKKLMNISNKEKQKQKKKQHTGVKLSSVEESPDNESEDSTAPSSKRNSVAPSKRSSLASISTELENGSATTMKNGHLNGHFNPKYLEQAQVIILNRFVLFIGNA